MKQLLMIHGGNCYKDREAYLRALRGESFSLPGLMKRSWKERFRWDPPEGYQILLPKMPNPDDAKYEEWQIRFELILPALQEEILLLGHSLGGIFLAKYLSENTIRKKIRALFLIAAPFECEGFKLPPSLDLLNKQAGSIVLYHSKDDPVVPPEEAERYRKVLPNAKIKLFEKEGHFTGETIPDLQIDLDNA